jgi:fumarate reductase flavoprotein subunit
MDGDRCVGVTGTHHGKSFEILARHVLVADGGFQSDSELVGEEIAKAPEKLLQRNGQSGFGFGLHMVMAVGGQISSLKGFYGHLQTRDALDNPELWPYPWWDDVATASIVVDREGRRFCDEKRGGIYIANRLAELDDPQSAFVIFDEAVWNSAGRRGQIAANPNFVRAGATIHWAGEINVLAAKAGLNPQQLARSVEEFNNAANEKTFASTGGKQRTISHSPYFAAPICPGITYTMGGILTDEHGRVLDSANMPIPGLFAAGATTGGLEGGEGVGYVGGLIKSLTGALLASENMLGESI